MIFMVTDKVILIEEPFVEVTIQELIDQIRGFEASVVGMPVASLANGAGKESLGGGKMVGITLELINDWRVQFEDRASQTFCYVRGGNLVAKNAYDDNPIKPSTNVNVVLELSTSASLIESSVDIEKLQSIEDTVLENKENLLDVLSNVEFLKQIEGGKWKIESNQMIFYKEDNETEIMRFDIARDAEGNPVMRTRV